MKLAFSVSASLAVFGTLWSVALTTRMGQTAFWTIARPWLTPFQEDVPSAPLATAKIHAEGIRVIGAGPGRTGTSSLAEALHLLGYRPYHMDDCFIHGHADLWQQALDTGSIEPMLSVLQDLGYDAILDEPASAFVPQLVHHFPDAKIILTHRNSNVPRWIKSMQKLALLHIQYAEAPFTLIPHIQRFSAMAKRLLAQRGCGVSTLLNDDPEGTCQAWYHQHMADMKERFALDNQTSFLEYHVSEGWAPLEAFLETNVPTSLSFPWRNGGDEVKRLIQAMKFLRVLFYALVLWWGVRPLVSTAWNTVMSFLHGHHSCHRQTPTLSDLSSNVRIRRLSSAIPGVDGVPGYLIPTRLICRYLRERGIHNPKTGKEVTDDWVLRNLGIPSISLGLRTDIFDKVATPEELSIIKGEQQSSEQDLSYFAFDEAMEKANMKVKDLDVLIYVSCTEDDVHFNEGVRHWYERYPDLSKRLRLLFLPYGCPALVFAMQLARDMLHSPHIQNVAIVVSNSSSKFYNKESYDPFLRGNSMERWLNGCIFGDAAFSCILSTSAENLPSTTYKLVDADIVCDPDVFISSRFKENGENGIPKDMFHLNPKGPKEIPKSLRSWLSTMKTRFGYTLDSFQHIVFHQANPNVLRKVCDYFQCHDKTCIIGENYGNLGCTSVGCALHHRLEKSAGIQPRHGDLIMGYALGALTGNSHGVFILECEVH